MSQVPVEATPFTAGELVAALSLAYASQMGHAPANHALAVLCAQLALETANGRSCQNHNPGNYKRGCTDDWYEIETFEFVGEPPVETKMVCQFSAWPDLASALAFIVRALYTRYPEAWHAAVAGDAAGFAAGLRQRGYYTAPLAQYAAGVERWASYYLALLGGDSAPTEPELPSLGDAAAMAREGLAAEESTDPQ